VRCCSSRSSPRSPWRRAGLYGGRGAVNLDSGDTFAIEITALIERFVTPFRDQEI